MVDEGPGIWDLSAADPRSGALSRCLRSGSPARLRTAPSRAANSAATLCRAAWRTRRCARRRASLRLLELTAVDRGVTYHRVPVWVRHSNLWPRQGRVLCRCTSPGLKTLRIRELRQLEIGRSALATRDAYRHARCVRKGEHIGVRVTADMREPCVSSLPDKIFTKDYLKSTSSPQPRQRLDKSRGAVRTACCRAERRFDRRNRAVLESVPQNVLPSFARSGGFCFFCFFLVFFPTSGPEAARRPSAGRPPWPGGPLEPPWIAAGPDVRRHVFDDRAPRCRQLTPCRTYEVCRYWRPPCRLSVEASRSGWRKLGAPQARSRELVEAHGIAGRGSTAPHGEHLSCRRSSPTDAGQTRRNGERRL